MTLPTLAERLGHFLSRSLYSYGQLAELAGIPRRTVANWISGVVTRPRTWHDLLRVAHALGLTEAETNELLRAAGFGPLASLRVAAEDADGRQLVSLWIPINPRPISETSVSMGSVALLRTYLATLASELARLPAYFPRHLPFTLERIAQQTHVRAVTPVPAGLTDVVGNRDAQPWSQVSSKLTRTTVIGHAGIGKTHLLRREAVSAAQSALAVWPIRSNAEIPIFVRLTDLAPLLPDHPRLADTLAATARAAALQVPALPAEAVERLLGQLLETPAYSLLLLLDGWDEVGSASGLYTRLTMALAQLRGIPGARMILTSRPEANYEQAAAATLSQVVMQVEPLDISQVQRFIRSWFYGRRELEWPLRVAVRDSPNLARLASIPLMLTMLTILAELGKIDAAGKMDLYNRLLRLVLEGRWRLHDLQLPESRVHAKLRALQVLAWSMATDGGAWKVRLPLPVAEEMMVALPVADRLRATWFDAWGGPYSGVLWELMEWDNLLRAEMTVGPGGNISTDVSFLHFPFQQYLAAAYLLKRFEEAGTGAPEVQTLADGLILQPEWLEVLRLWVDHLRFHPAYGASALLKALLLPAVRGAQPLPDHLVVILGELQAAGIHLFAEETAAENIPAQLLDVMQKPTASARVRVYAGRVLGAVGDPRAAVMDVDAIDFVEVAAGRFMLGGDYSGDHSGVTGAEVEDLTPYTGDLPTYWIGRMPVTNAQYALFLQEGYDDPVYWPEAVALGLWRAGQVLRAEPVSTSGGHLSYRVVWTRTPYAPRWPFDLSNHPAGGINWFEARAFARWLDMRRRAAGLGVTNYHIDLPNELEWEKAARGCDGRVYPWGNEFVEDRLNWAGQLLHGPNAVGCYPDGAGPYGLLDMVGNIPEWTRTVYRPYDLQGRIVAEAESRIVLRGGGYYSPMSACRCAARSTAEAIGRLAYCFRVALVPDREEGDGQ